MKFKCIFQLLSHKENSSLILFTSQSERGGKITQNVIRRRNIYVFNEIITPPPPIFGNHKLQIHTFQLFCSIILQHVHVSHVEEIYLYYVLLSLILCLFRKINFSLLCIRILEHNKI